MEYLCVDARFLFFNGKLRYTVHFAYGLSQWFVFKDKEESNCVHKKLDKKIKYSNVNRDSAELVLYEYLDKT